MRRGRRARLPSDGPPRRHAAAHQLDALARRGRPAVHAARGTRSSGVAIADLTVIRGDDRVAVEVIVEFRCGGVAEHRAALRDWAARVGYRRVWFDGEIADLDPSPGGAAQTRCTGCRARLADAGPSFWQFVRRYGEFPTACMLCGSDLPQWTALRHRRPGRAVRASPGRHPAARHPRSMIACAALSLVEMPRVVFSTTRRATRRRRSGGVGRSEPLRSPRLPRGADTHVDPGRAPDGRASCPSARPHRQRSPVRHNPR